ncbi:MAG: RICIN domain-containing protein [Lachnospiraceae bacterium]|nr:RICIN domain-containing protein [Lachnospiraceae bacterium]
MKKKLLAGLLSAAMALELFSSLALAEPTDSPEALNGDTEVIEMDPTGSHLEIDGVAYTVTSLTTCEIQSVVEPGEVFEIPSTITTEYEETYTVTGVAENAFSGAAGLKKLIIPAELTSFGGGSRLADLAEIVVKEGNESLFVRNGALYEKTEDGLELVLYPSAAGKDAFAVAAGTTAIRARAFYGAQKLTKVYVPASVKAIGSEVFADFIQPSAIALDMEKAPETLGEKAISLTVASDNVLYLQNDAVLEEMTELQPDFAGESALTIVTEGIPEDMSALAALDEDAMNGAPSGPNQPITDLAEGWYVITSDLSEISATYALDIEAGAGSATKDANADIFALDSTNVLDSQLFYVIAVDAAKGLYSFKPFGNDKYALDCDNGSANPGTNIRQHKSNGTAAQCFYVLSTDTVDAFQLRVANGNTCMTVKGNKAVDGANVELGTWANARGQKWLFNPASPDARTTGGIAEGWYYVESKLQDDAGNSYALDIDKGSGTTLTRANLDVMKKAAGAEAQMFYIKKVLNKADHYQFVANCAIQRVFDCESGAYVNGTNVRQYKSNGTIAQEFKAIKNADGTYEFKNAQANTCLTIESKTGVPAAKAADGLNVALGTWRGLDSQKWTLTDASADVRSIVQLDEGWYTISSVLTDTLSTPYALDIDNHSGSSVQDANLDIYQYTVGKDSEPQLFYVTKVDSGRYTFTPWGARTRVFDCKDGLLTPGTNVRQHKANGTAAQIFTVLANKDGSCSIKMADSASCLTVVDGSGNIATEGSNGANVQLGAWADADAQKWAFVKSTTRNFADTNLAKGIYEIHTGAGSTSASDTSTKTLTIGNPEMRSGSNIQINSQKNADTQKFLLTPAGNSKYYITNLASGKAVGLAGGKAANNTNVDIGHMSYASSQLWTIKKDSEGYYRLYSELKLNGTTPLCMDVENGKDEENRNVQIYQEAFSKSMAQRWIIVPSTAGLPTNGTYEIASAVKAGRTQIFDTPARATTEGLQYQIYLKKKITSQMFNITVSGDKATMQNLRTNKYVGVSSNKVVQQTSAYQWQVVPTGDLDGSVYLKAKDGRYITTTGNSAADGTLIVLQSSPSAGSKWILNKTSVANGWNNLNGTFYYYSSGKPLKSAYIGNAFVDKNGALWTGWHRVYQSGGVFKEGYYYYWDGKNGGALDARPWMMSSTKWQKVAKNNILINNHNNYKRINQTGINTAYGLMIDTVNCWIIVLATYPGTNAYNTPVCAFKMSPGLPPNDTNLGNSYVRAQKNWQELMGPSYGQYVSLINTTDGEYIHSVACGYANDHNLDAGTYNLLGQRASHGCMRVAVRNAFWIYAYVPIGSPAWIRAGEYPMITGIVPQPKMTGSTPVDPTDPAYTGNYGYTDTRNYYGGYYLP